MATVIKNCSCDSPFQDKKYGKKNRVFNTTAKNNNTGIRCTVCLKEK